LRPYLVRPRTENVPFLRAREGGFADSLRRSSRSAAGVYDNVESERAPGSAAEMRDSMEGEVHTRAKGESDSRMEQASPNGDVQ
ncbi:MAG: hypothetical protein ABI134_01385, partial [Byssovorax sp.]